PFYAFFFLTHYGNTYSTYLKKLSLFLNNSFYENKKEPTPNGRFFHNIHFILHLNFFYFRFFHGFSHFCFIFFFFFLTPSEHFFHIINYHVLIFFHTSNIKIHCNSSPNEIVNR